MAGGREEGRRGREERSVMSSIHLHSLLRLEGYVRHPSIQHQRKEIQNEIGTNTNSLAY